MTEKVRWKEYGLNVQEERRSCAEDPTRVTDWLGRSDREKLG